MSYRSPGANPTQAARLPATLLSEQPPQINTLTGVTSGTPTCSKVESKFVENHSSISVGSHSRVAEKCVFNHGDGPNTNVKAIGQHLGEVCREKRRMRGTLRSTHPPLQDGRSITNSAYARGVCHPARSPVCGRPCTRGGHTHAWEPGVCRAPEQVIFALRAFMEEGVHGQWLVGKMRRMVSGENFVSIPMQRHLTFYSTCDALFVAGGVHMAMPALRSGVGTVPCKLLGALWPESYDALCAHFVENQRFISTEMYKHEEQHRGHKGGEPLVFRDNVNKNTANVHDLNVFGNRCKRNYTLGNLREKISNTELVNKSALADHGALHTALPLHSSGSHSMQQAPPPTRIRQHIDQEEKQKEPPASAVYSGLHREESHARQVQAIPAGSVADRERPLSVSHNVGHFEQQSTLDPPSSCMPATAGPRLISSAKPANSIEGCGCDGTMSVPKGRLLTSRGSINVHFNRNNSNGVMIDVEPQQRSLRPRRIGQRRWASNQHRARHFDDNNDDSNPPQPNKDRNGNNGNNNKNAINNRLSNSNEHPNNTPNESGEGENASVKMEPSTTTTSNTDQSRSSAPGNETANRNQDGMDFGFGTAAPHQGSVMFNHSARTKRNNNRNIMNGNQALVKTNRAAGGIYRHHRYHQQQPRQRDQTNNNRRRNRTQNSVRFHISANTVSRPGGSRSASASHSARASVKPSQYGYGHSYGFAPGSTSGAARFSGAGSSSRIPIRATVSVRTTTHGSSISPGIVTYSRTGRRRVVRVAFNTLVKHTFTILHDRTSL